MTARFIGQTNLDYTLPGRSYKKEEPKKDEAKKTSDQKSNEKKKDEPEKKDEKKPESKKVDKKEDNGKDPKREARKDEPAKKAPAKKADEKKDEAAKKAEEKKPEEPDDVNAPLPGTTAPTKIPRVHPKKNGIRDLQITLHNLRPSKIKQVTINGQTDKGQASYRLDTSDSEDWPIAVRRSETDSTADLFLEPPQGDCFQKDFTINVMYEDNQNANVQAKVHVPHRSPTRPSPRTSRPSRRCTPGFTLTGDDVINGYASRGSPGTG